LPRESAEAGTARSDAPIHLLTVIDIAERLQVSPREVRRWVATGRLPVVRFGRAVRVHPGTLEHLMSHGLAD
jgi:excisionase family DNA binding protein